MPVKPRPRLLFVVTEDWYFCSHRISLAKAMRKAGIDVSVATRVTAHGQLIADEGLKLIPLRVLRRDGTLLRDLAATAELVRIYREERPDVVHHVALKPALFGSLAAPMARVPCVVNAFAGLGYSFIGQTLGSDIRRRALTAGLKFVLRAPRSRAIFQNEEDRELFIKEGIVSEDKTRLIRGSGVDIKEFTPCVEPDLPPVVMLASRMLWDKGVGEFVKAAGRLRQLGLRAKYVLVGMVDGDNPASIPEKQLLAWQHEGTIEWWGHREDMPRVLASAHIVVLPSYREGLPKILLEASACARPLVATDVPGCREIVRDGENGLLVPARDAEALAHAIATLVNDLGLRAKMGALGRRMVEENFSDSIVAEKTLAVYRELLGGDWRTMDLVGTAGS